MASLSRLVLNSIHKLPRRWRKFAYEHHMQETDNLQVSGSEPITFIARVHCPDLTTKGCFATSQDARYPAVSIHHVDELNFTRNVFI